MIDPNEIDNFRVGIRYMQTHCKATGNFLGCMINTMSFQLVVDKNLAHKLYIPSDFSNPGNFRSHTTNS